MNSNPRRRKHVESTTLDVLLPLENGPSPKRIRRSMRRRTPQAPPVPTLISTAEQESSTMTSRTGKRRQHSDGNEIETNDENQFNDLEESIKRLRIRRPLFFSITTFIEQSVDSVTYSLGDGEPEVVDATVTLPLSPL